MPSRSCAVSSRLARSATYATSFSLTFISSYALRCAPRPAESEIRFFPLAAPHIDSSRPRSAEPVSAVLVSRPHRPRSPAEFLRQNFRLAYAPRPPTRRLSAMPTTQLPQVANVEEKRRQFSPIPCSLAAISTPG